LGSWPVPLTQELRKTIQTCIGLGVETVFGEIPFAADHQHRVADIIPVPGMHNRVSPTKLRHCAQTDTDTDASLQLRHPWRECPMNDRQIAPATELCARSCYRHDYRYARRTSARYRPDFSAQAGVPHC